MTKHLDVWQLNWGVSLHCLARAVMAPPEVNVFDITLFPTSQKPW